ncbi:MAG: hypothetical protein WD894_04455 [Pirellulales bacterium]
MRKPSGFVLFLLLGALVLSMCAGGAFLYATRMPDPATADLRGLLRWLVTRDLSRESTEVQEQLLTRLELELRNGLDVDGARDQLSEIQQAQLLENADFLGRLWFLKQVDRYFAQIDAQRLRFLDQLIDEVHQSGIAKTLSALMAQEGHAAPGNMWAGLRERIQQWTIRLEPQRKAQAEQFVAAVHGSLLLRTLRATFSSSG